MELYLSGRVYKGKHCPGCIDFPITSWTFYKRSKKSQFNETFYNTIPGFVFVFILLIVN